MGVPPIRAVLRGTTISSPWLPRARASTASGRTPAARAARAQKRVASSTPAIPSTRRAGKPVVRHTRWVISSSGLVTTTTTAFGECVRIPSATPPTMAALAAVRSVRLIPGWRARPAVTTT
jgi:hypothetical protein